MKSLFNEKEDYIEYYDGRKYIDEIDLSSRLKIASLILLIIRNDKSPSFKNIVIQGQLITTFDKIPKWFVNVCQIVNE